MFKDNLIIVVCLPAHLPQVLQPLDLTVFASFKSYLERKLHSASRLTHQLDALTLVRIISDVYEQGHVGAIIRTGFAKGDVSEEINGHEALETLRKFLFYTDLDS